MGECEIFSYLIGECIMELLKKLDKVVYVCFVLVYCFFEDICEFGEEIVCLGD